MNAETSHELNEKVKSVLLDNSDKYCIYEGHRIIELEEQLLKAQVELINVTQRQLSDKY